MAKIIDLLGYIAGRLNSKIVNFITGNYYSLRDNQSLSSEQINSEDEANNEYAVPEEVTREEAINRSSRMSREVWSKIKWRYHPLRFEDKNISCSTDDAAIRSALIDLARLDSSSPSPEIFEKASENPHLVLIDYNKGFVLYWITYYATKGDSGYVCYRFKNFLDMPFNFLHFGNRMRIDSDQIGQIFIFTQRQAEGWISELNLPYTLSPVFLPDFIGLVKQYK